ncbi:unnamed protein product [Clonostachys solani]|uniref:Uncharacterized protein n=1 Tax=Clonostachys solani TaxID=160281 RepID=A0A9N9WC47_9HYPO|nr:unnamed protein product [Clonostachys solani]
MDSGSELQRLRARIAQLEQTNEQLEKTNEQLEKTNERLEQDNELQQNTTLSQYLDNCHHHLFASLTVRPDISGTSVTKVDGKYYPSSLSAWGDFARLQQHQFELLEGALKDERLFPSYIGVREMQRRACETPVANEDDIKPFEHIAVEGPVMDIIRALCAKADSNSRVAALHTSRISFANHSLSIHIPVDEVIQSTTREKQRRNTSPTKRVAIEPKEIRPDRRCLREDTEGNRSIAFVVEYKAAHKLQINQVRRGLNEHLFSRAIKRRLSGKSRTDDNQALEDRSDNVLAMVLTQTFDYMIRLGLEYSYLTAGKSFIFLRVKADDPKTLYYHLADPDDEAEDEDGELNLSRTAVAQVAGFSLLALRSNLQPAKWTSEAQAELSQWPIPYSEMERESTDDEVLSQRFSLSSDPYFPEEDIDSPKQKMALRSRSACKDSEVIKKDDRDDADDADNAKDDINLPSHRKGNELSTKRKDAPSSSSSFEETSDGREQSRQYCTMDCLLGLKRGQELDAKCPNVALHRKVVGDVLHPISFDHLANLTQQQLARSLERDCEPLEMRGKYGAVGTLFRLSLTQYGYTFVGKGTIQPFVPHLEHEARVYRRLERLQGEVIPVYIGSIDLMKPYHLTARNAVRFAGHEIVHMLLMSWAGEVAVKVAKGIDAGVEAAKTLNMMKKEKVYYDDVREPNLLWNEERHRVMVIDFHSAELIAPSLAGMKRPRTSGRGNAQRPKRVTLHAKKYGEGDITRDIGQSTTSSFQSTSGDDGASASSGEVFSIKTEEVKLVMGDSI